MFFERKKIAIKSHTLVGVFRPDTHELTLFG